MYLVYGQQLLYGIVHNFLRNFLSYTVINDWSFDFEYFQEFLQPAIESIVMLVEQSSESYTNTEIINIIGVLCRQVGDKVSTNYVVLLNC